MQARTAIFFILALLCCSISFAVTLDNPTHGGCVISTSEGALQDADCDRQSNPFDNCPLTPNPDQVDRDENGIGDACDLIIDEIRVEPEAPVQGRSMITTIAITNNRAYPMRNIVLKAEAPKLGIATNEDVSLIQSGERVRRELIMRIPECASTKFTDIVVIAEYPFSPGQKEVFSQAIKVPIHASGVCEKEQANTKTVVDILELQDVDPVNGAIYPFTIRNTEPESRAYVLSVEGIDSWGYAEIHPGTVIVVPPGAGVEGAIQVWALEGVSGRKSFTLTMQARDDIKQVMLNANIPAPAAKRGPPSAKLLFGIIAFLGLLVLIGIVVVFAFKPRNEKTKK